MIKLYKFNMHKYGHNIDLAYNHARNRLGEETTTEEDVKAFNEVSEIYQQLLGASDGYFAHVPYDVWQKATEISMWATDYRGQCNARRSY